MATITKRGETYKITVSCGYDMAGKQIRKNLTWKPAPGMTAKQIEKEVERQKVLFEEKCRTGQFLDGSTKFADFADKWMKEYAEKQLRPKTLAGYQALMKRIIPAIGHIRLDKLQPAHLLAFYDNLEESEMRDDQKYVITVDLMKALTESGIKKTAFAKMAKVGISTLDSAIQGNNVSKKSAEKISAALSKPINAVFKTADADSHLSGKTILHHHRLISSILSTAVQWQVIFSNPCERVKPPKVEKKEPRYLDEEEASRLLDLLDYEDIQYRTMIKLLLFTGFRRGELLGLEWPDIDFKSHVIHVRRSSLYLPEKGIFVDETKNATSSRTVKVQDDAFQMLREFRQWQTAQRLQVGDKWESTDRL